MDDWTAVRVTNGGEAFVNEGRGAQGAKKNDCG